MCDFGLIAGGLLLAGALFGGMGNNNCAQPCAQPCYQASYSTCAPSYGAGMYYSSSYDYSAGYGHTGYAGSAYGY